MTYSQKNNPFKKTTEPTGDNLNKRLVSNPEDLKLAKRLNKLRFDMGHIYPITSEKEVRDDDLYDIDYFKKNPDIAEKSVQRQLLNTAQTEEERRELYATSPTGSSTNYPREHANNYKKDLAFIKTARKAGGNVFEKIMNMPEKDLASFEQEIIKTAQPFRGKNLGDDTIATLGALKNLDLSNFKPYLQKSGLEVDDIRNVITSQLNELPDLNKDGKPDAFEGIKGHILKKSIDYLISNKLKSLR